ncbi:hypothetical protein D3C77_617090 [compost metagenome]
MVDVGNGVGVLIRRVPALVPGLDIGMREAEVELMLPAERIEAPVHRAAHHVLVAAAHEFTQQWRRGKAVDGDGHV